MRHNIPFFLVFLLCLLATACAGASSQSSLAGPTPTPPPLRSGLHVVLVPANGSGTPTQEALSATRTTLALRLAAFGLKNASVHELTSGNQPALQVEVPHFGGDERATLNTLVETGQLAFWDSGPAPVPVNSPFDPTQFTHYNPGNQPWFTENDLDTSRISVGTDQVGKPDIVLQMKGDAIARFSQFTVSHIDDYLTLTLDKKVLLSAFIVSRITSPIVITGNFTRQQATAIASVLKYPSLLVALQISSETPF